MIIFSRELPTNAKQKLAFFLAYREDAFSLIKKGACKKKMKGRNAKVCLCTVSGNTSYRTTNEKKIKQTQHTFLVE